MHVTYHLNRLQALREPVDYCVTLNQTTRIAPGPSCAGWSTSTRSTPTSSLAAQALLPALQGERNTYYCGAYHGWGFHEDGCVSGLRAALRPGVRLVRSALYEGQVVHERRDRPPQPVPLPRLHLARRPRRAARRSTGACGRSARPPRPDHDPLPRPPRRPGRAIRENVDAYLAAHGIDLDGGRVRC